MDEVVARLEGGANTAEQLNQAIAEIWLDLKAHPQYLPAGLDIDLNGAPPLHAQQLGAHLGIVETLVVAALGGLAKSAADTLWKEVFWPALKARIAGLKART